MKEQEYIVSYLKYRPQNFDDVVGQSHITIALKNSIENNHIPQAILFCGSRGTGKTTCARILAKEINKKYISLNKEEDYFYNIFELDAASNNSVDDIRNLIEQVNFPPQKGKYKVYIIDEVHMLSTSAFNAFLKTLEEPPKHAIFILATTEKHKIIPTILSRCQIFDFKKISNEDISNHLKIIAKKENVKYEDEALYQISKKAEGGLRDALSLFDRVSLFSDNNITLKSANENLNILDYDYYFKITEFLLAENIKDSIITFNEIIDLGFDGRIFISGLASHFRNLILARFRDEEVIKLINVSESTRKEYILQAEKVDDKYLISALKICEKTELDYRASHNQMLLIEIALMKISNINYESKKKK